MAVIPLNDDASNIPEFIDSLFSDDARPISNVTAAAKSTDVASFVDHASRKIILESWLAAWRTWANEDPGDYKSYIRPLDQNIINFMAWFIASNNLRMRKPSLDVSSISVELNDKGDQLGVPFYKVSGYTDEVFRNADNTWNYGTFDENGKPTDHNGTVTRFLWYLFHGAHFVFICDGDDGAVNVPQFEPTFEHNVNRKRKCPGNTHYSAHTNLYTDWYYLSIESNTTPPDTSSYILALLAGNTSGNDRNGFLQLEGWQAQVDSNFHGGERHENDLDTHLATIWNISTFGASAYSEKRSTPIFLAQESFSTAIDPATHMPLYTGAGSLQKWMNPGYITGGKIDEVLLDVADDLGHFYFFQGTQVIHYDTVDRKPHGGYPRPISDIFPHLGFDTIDAAFAKPGTNGAKGTYYFFHGASFVHYDAPSKKVLSKGSISDFDGITFPALDAAVYASQADGEWIYFFSGEKYQRFNVAKNKAEGAPQAIAALFGLGEFPGFTSVDAVEYVSRPPGSDGDLRLHSSKFLLFHNDQVGFYDVTAKKLPKEDIRHIYGKEVFPGLWWK